MIDLFSLGVSHGLMLLALWHLLGRSDLDRDPPPDASPEEPRDA